MKKLPTKFRRLVSVVTILLLTITQTAIPSLAAPAPLTEVKLQTPAFDLSLPPELGTIQTLVSGPGPTVIHIQTAHGNFEAQKKIEAILHHLKQSYGIKLLLLEGTSFKLEPELLRFFPKRRDLTQEIAEDLAKKAMIKGSELFLLEAEEAEAYGIENLEAYVSNGEAFVEVMTQKEKTEKFLQEMDLQIERLASPHLSPRLRAFLKQLERFENKTFPLLDWLSYLKTQGQEHLEMDLAHPSYQLDWPMLFRMFKLREFEAKIDMNAFTKERSQFLSVIARRRSQRGRSNLDSGIARGSAALEDVSSPPKDVADPRNDFEQIEKLLSSPLSQHQLPDPETGLLFERMVSSLPEDFPYQAYPNVVLFIGHLILQSELKGERLMKEMNLLTDDLSEKLSDTKESRSLLTLLKDYRLLKRLFALELTPEDYSVIAPQGLPRSSKRKIMEGVARRPKAGEAISEIAPHSEAVPRSSGLLRRQGLPRSYGINSINGIASASLGSPPRNDNLRPSNVIQRFLNLNQARRVHSAEFKHVNEIDSLFDKALVFYEGVKARDRFMLENIEKRLRETGQEKAVVITGGFHAGPFQEYFKTKGYNYALIAPKITNVEGREAYLEATLQNGPTQFIKATRETVYPFLPLRKARRERVNALLALDHLIGAELRVTEKAGELPNIDDLAQGVSSRNYGLSYRSPIKGPGGEGIVVAYELDRLTGGRRKGIEEIFLPFGPKTVRRVVVEERETPTLDLTRLRRRTRQKTFQPERHTTSIRSTRSALRNTSNASAARSEVRGRGEKPQVPLRVEALESRTLLSSITRPSLTSFAPDFKASPIGNTSVDVEPDRIIFNTTGRGGVQILFPEGLDVAKGTPLVLGMRGERIRRIDIKDSDGDRIVLQGRALKSLRDGFVEVPARRLDQRHIDKIVEIGVRARGHGEIITRTEHYPEIQIAGLAESYAPGETVHLTVTGTDADSTDTVTVGVDEVFYQIPGDSRQYPISPEAYSFDPETGIFTWTLAPDLNPGYQHFVRFFAGSIKEPGGYGGASVKNVEIDVAQREQPPSVEEIGKITLSETDGRVFFTELGRLRNGNLGNYVDANGVLHVEEGLRLRLWAGDGGQVVQSVPGQNQGFHYVYFWARTTGTAAIASFNLELPGLMYGDLISGRKRIDITNEWQRYEVPITRGGNLSYFAVSDTSAPVELAGFRIEKEALRSETRHKDVGGQARTRELVIARSPVGATKQSGAPKIASAFTGISGLAMTERSPRSEVRMIQEGARMPERAERIERRTLLRLGLIGGAVLATGGLAGLTGYGLLSPLAEDRARKELKIVLDHWPESSGYTYLREYQNYFSVIVEIYGGNRFKLDENNIHRSRFRRDEKESWLSRRIFESSRDRSRYFQSLASLYTLLLKKPWFFNLYVNLNSYPDHDPFLPLSKTTPPGYERYYLDDSSGKAFIEFLVDPNDELINGLLDEVKTRDTEDPVVQLDMVQRFHEAIQARRKSSSDVLTPRAEVRSVDLISPRSEARAMPKWVKWTAGVAVLMAASITVGLLFRGGPAHVELIDIPQAGLAQEEIDFRDAKKDLNQMIDFMGDYFERRGYTEAKRGFLEGVAQWYLSPGAKGSRVNVERPFSEFEQEVNERLGEWVREELLRKIAPRAPPARAPVQKIQEEKAIPPRAEKTERTLTPPPAETQEAQDQKVKYQPSDETVRVIQESLKGVGNYIKGPGVHGPTGAPNDHVQINAEGRDVGRGTYGAPSKDGVFLPTLFQIAQGNPLLNKFGISREEALKFMLGDLRSLREFQKNYEGREVYGGLFPWNRYGEDGSRRLADYAGRRMVPILDNSQTTLPLTGIVGAFWDAPRGSLERQVRDLAQEILDHQDYSKYKDPKTGLLFPEWSFDTNSGAGNPGHVHLWTEWAMAYLYAYWVGDITEEAWLKLNNETFVWDSPKGPLDMPQNFIFSFHEAWIVQYLHETIMKSRLAPLYLDFLYYHIDWAMKNNMAGFAATEYDNDGYTSSGPKARGVRILGGIQNPRLQTPYGTAFGTLIHPPAVEWLRYLFGQPGVVKLYGPVTSFTREKGASRHHTADSTFGTVNAMAEWYLLVNPNPRYLSMDDAIGKYFEKKYGKTEADLIRAFDLHAEAILRRISQDPVRFEKLRAAGLEGRRNEFISINPADIPGPPEEKDFSVKEKAEKQTLEDNVGVSARLQPGHWHAGRVFVPKDSPYAAWGPEQPWVMKEGEIYAHYDIPDREGEKYAYLGTNLTVAIPLSAKDAEGKVKKYESISFWVPADLKDESWQLEFKKGSEEVALRVPVRTNAAGTLSKDGKWKRLVVWFAPKVGESVANYFAISVEDPHRQFTSSKPKGVIHIKDIQFHLDEEDVIRKKPADGPGTGKAPAKEGQFNEAAFIEAQKDLDSMKKFVQGYLERRGYKISQEGWLSGFAPWYLTPDVTGSRVNVLRPFQEFEGEMDERLQEWVDARLLEKTEPKSSQHQKSVEPEKPKTEPSPKKDSAPKKEPASEREAFDEAQKDLNEMKNFVRSYLDRKGYSIGEEGWLSGFAPWYLLPDTAGSRVKVIRPFSEFEQEMREKLDEWVGQGALQKKPSRAEVRSDKGISSRLIDPRIGTVVRPGLLVVRDIFLKIRELGKMLVRQHGDPAYRQVIQGIIEGRAKFRKEGVGKMRREIVEGFVRSTPLIRQPYAYAQLREEYLLMIKLLEGILIGKDLEELKELEKMAQEEAASFQSSLENFDHFLGFVLSESAARRTEEGIPYHERAQFAIESEIQKQARLPQEKRTFIRGLEAFLKTVTSDDRTGYEILWDLLGDRPKQVSSYSSGLKRLRQGDFEFAGEFWVHTIYPSGLAKLRPEALERFRALVQLLEKENEDFRQSMELIRGLKADIDRAAQEDEKALAEYATARRLDSNARSELRGGALRNPQPHKQLTFEPLEDRQLLSTHIPTSGFDHAPVSWKEETIAPSPYTILKIDDLTLRVIPNPDSPELGEPVSVSFVDFAEVIQEQELNVRAGNVRIGSAEFVVSGGTRNIAEVGFEGIADKVYLFIERPSRLNEEAVVGVVRGKRTPSGDKLIYFSEAEERPYEHEFLYVDNLISGKSQQVKVSSRQLFFPKRPDSTWAERIRHDSIARTLVNDEYVVISDLIYDPSVRDSKTNRITVVSLVDESESAAVKTKDIPLLPDSRFVNDHSLMAGQFLDSARVELTFFNGLSLVLDISGDRIAVESTNRGISDQSVIDLAKKIASLKHSFDVFVEDGRADISELNYIRRLGYIYQLKGPQVFPSATGNVFEHYGSVQEFVDTFFALASNQLAGGWRNPVITAFVDVYRTLNPSVISEAMEQILEQFPGETEIQFQQRIQKVRQIWDDHKVLIRYGMESFSPTRQQDHFERHLQTLDLWSRAMEIPYPPNAYELTDIFVVRSFSHTGPGIFYIDLIGHQATKVLRTFIHETGHIFHYMYIPKDSWQHYVTLFEESSGEDFITDYRNNEFEDFAELVAEWGMDGRMLLQRALDQAVQGKPILLEKILFLDSVYPQEWAQLTLYSTDPMTNDITASTIPVERDSQWKITKIRLERDGDLLDHEIKYDAEKGRVIGVTQEEVSIPKEEVPSIASFSAEMDQFNNLIAEGHIPGFDSQIHRAFLTVVSRTTGKTQTYEQAVGETDDLFGGVVATLTPGTYDVFLKVVNRRDPNQVLDETEVRNVVVRSVEGGIPAGAIPTPQGDRFVILAERPTPTPGAPLSIALDIYDAQTGQLITSKNVGSAESLGGVGASEIEGFTPNGEFTIVSNAQTFRHTNVDGKIVPATFGFAVPVRQINLPTREVIIPVPEGGNPADFVIDKVTPVSNELIRLTTRGGKKYSFIIGPTSESIIAQPEEAPPTGLRVTSPSEKKIAEVSPDATQVTVTFRAGTPREFTRTYQTGFTEGTKVVKGRFSGKRPRLILKSEDGQIAVINLRTGRARLIGQTTSAAAIDRILERGDRGILPIDEALEAMARGPRSEVRLADGQTQTIGVKREALSVQPEARMAELARSLGRSEVRTVAKEFTAKGLRMRFEPLGRQFLEAALNSLGVPAARAETAVPSPMNWARLEQEISTLGALKDYSPPRTESQPTLPRAIFDYRSALSENPADYDLLVLLAASDRNLKLTLWLAATENQLDTLQTKLTQYAQSRYGLYPGNLKIEPAPQNIVGEVFARAKKGKVPTGFVSSDRGILPKVNAGRGVMLADGSSSPGLTSFLLARRLLDFSLDRLDPKIYTGPDLAEGRWAELMASMEARQAFLAAA